MGANVFKSSGLSAVLFEGGIKLNKFSREALADCQELKAFNVPESSGILGNKCFAGCSQMVTIEFEGSSGLRIIGKLAFIGCELQSITIPAWTQEIDGYAFVNSPLISIQVAAENPNLIIERNLLITSDGTEIVRYFAMD
jgi:hypothetical protein